MSIEDGTLTIGVPSVFVKDWLQDKYQAMILKPYETSPHVRSLDYAVIQRTSRRSKNNPKTQTVNAKTST